MLKFREMLMLPSNLVIAQVRVNIGIDTNIEVIVVSLTIWEANHSPRAVVSFPGR